MKAKLNLTIEQSLLSKMKSYAENNKVSISELVEGYFQSLAKPVRNQNIIEMVEKLQPSKLGNDKDLKKSFYEEQAGKYGL